jgi:hypothetical protein
VCCPWATIHSVCLPVYFSTVAGFPWENVEYLLFDFLFSFFTKNIFSQIHQSPTRGGAAHNL